MSDRWTAERIPDQTGRTFVVTGANSGLGYLTTKQLARHGAHVIMAVRDEAKGVAAAANLADEQPYADLEVRRLDLADLDSVREFAAGLVADEVPVDVLINNAGIMATPHGLSPQGNEMQFATNHLGHFALTGLLVDTLRGGREPRVVTVSSLLHEYARLDFDNLTGATGYQPLAFYNRSKLANVLFGLELDRRLRSAGIEVRSLLAHPGYADTPLHSYRGSAVVNGMVRLSARLFAVDANIAVLPQLYAATVPGAGSGQFIGPNGIAGYRGYPAVVQPSETGRNHELARLLWQVSEDLTGVRFDLPAVV